MKSVIIGTAGHIDHGKTALVKALTGIDADRLEEEKRRGITIDIGFAHLELPAPDGEPIRFGFVDVPGHERFVRNMLAGIGGIDIVLLVIAADESIKPQTREHFDICRLLSVRRGITVLTKADMVDRETLDVVCLEVEEFLRGSFMSAPDSPIIPVSSLTGQGLAELKHALVAAAADIQPKDAAALTRLPIDRVFTIKGFGTVVTGTLVSGQVHKEDELEVIPTGKRVRVRGVEVHDAPAEIASAGQRTALNLSGGDKEDLARGMTLAPPSTLNSTWRADASLSLLSSAKPLKDRARVHFHAYTSETIAEVVLYGNKQITPGQTAVAQFRFADPLLLLPGDRFIVRQFSPVITIGGGVVLDASVALRKTGIDEKKVFLKKLEEGSPGEVLAARTSRRGKAGLTMSAVVAETGWTSQRAAKIAADLLRSGEIIRAGEVFVAGDAFRSIAREVQDSVADFHKHNPLVPGISREALRERLDLGTEVFSSVLEQLRRDQKLQVTGEQVHLAGRSVVMKDEESESKKIIEAAFASAGLKVPALKDVLGGLRVDRVRAQKIVTLLLRDKILIKISEDLVFHRDALNELRTRVLAQKSTSPKIDVARFKDLTGVSRKYAIPLLEYLDRERVTRRVGDERIIL
jgi:selenocysteine-specific elongation factor